MDRRQQQQQEERRTNMADWANDQSQGFVPTAIRLPKGVEFYKTEKGSVLVDFMQYIVREDGVNPRADKGFEHCEREWYAHSIPVPGGRTNTYACFGCWNRDCPTCQLAQTLPYGDPLGKKIFKKTRHLWLINDKPGDASNKVKVFDSAHAAKGQGFGEQMSTLILAHPRGKDFASRTQGMSVRITCVEDTFPGGKWNKPIRLDFEPRKYTYPLSSAQNAPVLDDLIIPPMPKRLMNNLDSHPVSSFTEDEWRECQEEMERLLSGNPSPPATTQASVPAAPPAASESPADEPTADQYGLEVGMRVWHDEAGECVIMRVSGDGTSLTLKDGKGQPVRAVSPAEVTPLTDDAPAEEDAQEEPAQEESVGEEDQAADEGDTAAQEDDWDAAPVADTEEGVVQDEDDWDAAPEEDLDAAPPPPKPAPARKPTPQPPKAAPKPAPAKPKAAPPKVVAPKAAPPRPQPPKKPAPPPAKAAPKKGGRR